MWGASPVFLAKSEKASAEKFCIQNSDLLTTAIEMTDPNNNNYEDDDWISKTELKRQADESQKLGIRLTALDKHQLDELPLDESLRDAIELAQRIRNKREGYRRQLQYIGKLMRNRDCDDIVKALAKQDAKHHQANLVFHQLEQARDQMIAKGDEAIQAVMNDYPEADRQRLRQLARSAAKEKAANKTPKAARELFKYLRELSGL